MHSKHFLKKTGTKNFPISRFQNHLQTKYSLKYKCLPIQLKTHKIEDL